MVIVRFLLVGPVSSKNACGSIFLEYLTGRFGIMAIRAIYMPVFWIFWQESFRARKKETRGSQACKI